MFNIISRLKNANENLNEISVLHIRVAETYSDNQTLVSTKRNYITHTFPMNVRWYSNFKTQLAVCKKKTKYATPK